MYRLIFLILFSNISHALVIYQDGKFIKSYSREKLIAAGVERKVKYLNHLNNKQTTYIGIALNDIIKDAGIDDSKVEEIVFSALNGYRPYLNYQLFKNREAYLTYKSAGAKPFTRYSQKTKKIVELGPYYLVWKLDDLHFKHRLKYSSIYKIQAIDFKTNLYKLPFSDNRIKDGFTTYKRYCISCHKIENQGGTLSSELLSSKYLENEIKFTQYTSNPQSINPNSEMLAFPGFQNKIYKIQNIYHMLRLLKDAKNKKELNKKDIENLNELLNEFSTPAYGSPLKSNKKI